MEQMDVARRRSAPCVVAVLPHPALNHSRDTP